jgi:ADP-ribose pyrophosphatase YjhB (NUDIX family)
MTKIIFGDRVGREGKVRLGCAAVLFDTSRQNVLLTRRSDNGKWCLPSGGVESGESVTEACARETLEETGLTIQVERLVSIFSSPDRLVIYDDGEKFQFITIGFEVRLIAGQPVLSNETTAVCFFPIHDLEALDIFSHHKQFIMDALGNQNDAFLR